MKKKILIIGAGFLQVFVINKAKELGYHTIAIDKNPNSMGFLYSDEYEVVDIVDQAACLKYAQSKGIDGVMTAATDYGVLSASYVAKQMKLPGLDYEVAQVIKNKYLVRRTLFESMKRGVSQFNEINSIDELEKIIHLIRFPVMVKPCDGSGSKAVRKVESISELNYACFEALKSSLAGKALIEDFIEGREYGVESFVYKGEVYVLGVMGKYMTAPPDYAELGHCIPSGLNIEEKIKEVVRGAIKALNINFGAVNMDLLVSEDERICIVDIGARMGGNLIGSHLIPIGTGIDYTGNLISASVGEPIDLQPKSYGANVATRLLALTPGKVKKLPDFEEIKRKCRVDIYHHLNVGDTIRQYHNNLDGCGYVLALSHDAEEAERRAEEAKVMIDAEIERV